jgi:dTDP-4-amino-4,6-dideoxygalactose transaminase
MFPLIIVNEKISRNDLIEYLENHNVETRYLLPLINQPIYRKIFGDLEPKYPVAANLNKNGFYIGCHPEMTKLDLDYIVRVFNSFFARYG